MRWSFFKIESAVAVQFNEALGLLVEDHERLDFVDQRFDAGDAAPMTASKDHAPADHQATMINLAILASASGEGELIHTISG